jgi:hypothetical protein
MRRGTVAAWRAVLHLNSCWKKLLFEAADDFWVFPNQQNEIRNVLVLVQKYLWYWY